MPEFQEMISQNREALITIFATLTGITASVFCTIHIRQIKRGAILKKYKKWAGVLSVLGIVGIIFVLSWTKTSPVPPDRPVDFDKFIETLQNEDYTNKRVALLKKHSKMIPNQLSVVDVKKILELFQGDNRRLEVIKVLRNLRKLKKSYTENEIPEIQDMFNNYRRSEVEKWLK